MYRWMFKYRWYIGIGILLFLTLMRFHGDSIAFYHNTIQSGVGNDFSTPIFGVVRPIRSDEYVVGTPDLLASLQGENLFSVYNDVLRGTDTLNFCNWCLYRFTYIGIGSMEIGICNFTS